MDSAPVPYGPWWRKKEGRSILGNVPGFISLPYYISSLQFINSEHVNYFRKGERSRKNGFE